MSTQDLYKNIHTSSIPNSSTGNITDCPSAGKYIICVIVPQLKTIQKKEYTTGTYNNMDLSNIALSERSQTQNSKY